jgi:potassium-dependent mechanosensitive channel
LTARWPTALFFGLVLLLARLPSACAHQEPQPSVAVSQVRGQEISGLSARPPAHLAAPGKAGWQAAEAAPATSESPSRSGAWPRLRASLATAPRHGDSGFDAAKTYRYYQNLFESTTAGRWVGLIAILLLLMWMVRLGKVRVREILAPLAAPAPVKSGSLLARLGLALADNFYLIALALWSGLGAAVFGLLVHPAGMAFLVLLLALTALRLGLGTVTMLLGSPAAPGDLPLEPATAKFYCRHGKLILTYGFLGFGTLQAAAVFYPATVAALLFNLYLAGLLAWVWHLLRRPHPERLLAALPAPPWLAGARLHAVFRLLLGLALCTLLVALFLGLEQLADYLAGAAALTVGGFLLLWLLWLLAAAGLEALWGLVEVRHPRRRDMFQPAFSLAKRLISALFAAALALLTLLAWGAPLDTLKHAWFWLTWGPSLGTVRFTPLHLGLAALSLWLGYVLSRGGRALGEAKIFPPKDWDEGLRYSLSRFGHYAMISLSGLAALAILGFQLRTLALLAGALGLGLAVGFKDIGKDCASGLRLRFSRAIKEGDLLSIDGNLGRVQRINLRATIFQQNDGAVLIVPNSRMFDDAPRIWTYFGWRPMRLALTARVSYGSSIGKVTRIITDICTGNSRVVAEPPPQIFFQTFNDSSLDFTIWVHIRTPRDRVPAIRELNQAIHEALLQEGVEIPFPQRDLHVLSRPEAVQPFPLTPPSSPGTGKSL